MLDYVSNADRYQLWLIVQLYAYTYWKDSPALVQLWEKKLFLYWVLEDKVV